MGNKMCGFPILIKSCKNTKYIAEKDAPKGARIDDGCVIKKYTRGKNMK